MLPIVTIDGRAVADPDLRFTHSGRGVANLRVAANDSRKLDDGTWENTEQIFVSVPVWNSDAKPTLAEEIANTIRKGDRVIVTGKLYQREWEKDGEKRTAFEMKFPTVAKVIDVRRGETSSHTAPPPNDPWAGPAATNDEPPF